MTNETAVVPEALTFDQDPDKEHQRVLQAKTKAALGGWEVGARLLRMRETQDWRRVTVGGPYETWTEYLKTGCGVEVTTAMLYMQAAEFPLWVTVKYGVAAAGVLSRIVDITQAVETAEEATQLMLPTDDGERRSFDEMSYEQRQRALTLLAEELGVARQGTRPQTPERVAGRQMRDTLRAAAEPILKGGQIMTRHVGGVPCIDVKGIPLDKAAELFAMLAAALKPSTT